MKPTIPNTSEEKALAALVSASLHPWAHEATSEEIAGYLKDGSHLSSEEESMLNALQGRLFSPPPAASVDIDPCDELTMKEMLALHRKKPAEGFCQQTEEELEKRRKELVAKLQQKRRNSSL